MTFEAEAYKVSINLVDFRASLHEIDLEGLDSEFTLSTRNLVDKFNADGAHLNRWWVLTPVNWNCPCCGRSKSEIVRLNKNNYLTCQLHNHHDHMEDVVKSLFEQFSTERETIVADDLSEKFAQKIAFSLSAYDNTVVCFDCNKADSDAKKVVNAHRSFSFSPSEIREFIIVTPNQEHKIDEEKATKVWQRVKPIFETRLNLAKEFAKIAANKSDWYQPSKETAKQIERRSKIFFEHNGLLKIEKYETERLLYNPDPFKGSCDSWRKRKAKQADKSPSQKEIEHLSATRGKYWNKYPDYWKCNCCNRTKYDCVRPSKKNPWVLEIKSCSLFDLTNNSVIQRPQPICNDCMNTAINLGREVIELSGVNFKSKDGTSIVDASGIISIEELSGMIEARSHSTHLYNNQFIDKLIPELIKRARDIERTLVKKNDH